MLLCFFDQVDIGKVPDPRCDGEYIFDDWEEGICTCGLGYPEEEPCKCTVQEAGKEYFKSLFLEVNRMEDRVSHISVLTSYMLITCCGKM